MTRLPDYVSLSSDGQAEAPGETIEERCFSAALVCLEGHYTQSPLMGPQTAARVSSMISKDAGEDAHPEEGSVRVASCFRPGQSFDANLDRVARLSLATLLSGYGSPESLLPPSPASLPCLSDPCPASTTQTKASPLRRAQP